MNTEQMFEGWKKGGDELRELARRAALSLVADELRGMLAPPITVTIHPQPTRKLLPAAKRRGRPKGSKTKKRAMATSALEQRFCRKCRRNGGVEIVEGRTVRCKFCNAEWEARGIGGTAKKRLTPSVPAGACFRCDHAADKHPGGKA